MSENKSEFYEKDHDCLRHRPEAIKMCPPVNELKTRGELHTIICVTGQHRQMLDQVPVVFHVVPDYDLSIMKERQPIFDITVDIPLRSRSKNSGDPGLFQPRSICLDEEFVA